VVGKVEQALRDSGLAPALLEIELTESAIMQSGAEVTDTLNNLRELGIRLAIDDFGTGYSSLQHLRHFPIDKLKIDRSFIADLPGDPNAVAIVRAMITLGRSLHLEIVAEGVETPEQFRFLLDEHCDTLQGHYRAEAMDSVAFTALLREMKG
jgi:EAL domain-containing protein (putative c-di-GMP-specific phosphodiesterase class I)